MFKKKIIIRFELIFDSQYYERKTKTQIQILSSKSMFIRLLHKNCDYFINQ